MGTKLRKTALVLAVALLVVALAVAVVVNRYRDSIALEVANRALSDSGMSVTDVSVESIGAESVHFAQIVLELENGSILEIEGVSLPVAFSTLRGLRLHIRSVALVPNAADTGEPRLAAGLAAYLDASVRMRGAAIEVDEIVLPGTPLIRDFAWYADGMNPTLRLSIEGLDIFVTTNSISDSDHRASLRALTADDREALFIAFSILPFGEGYMLQGDASIMLEPLLPLLSSYGAVPDNVEMMSGALAGPFQLRIDADPGEPVLTTASLEMTAPLQVSVQHAGDSGSRVTIVDAAPITATLEYPSLAWTAGSDSLQLRISGGGLDQQPVFLDATSCSAGISCRTNATVTIDDIALGGLALESATLDARDIQLESADGNWQATSGNASLAIESPTYADRQFVTPSIRGIFRASNDELTTRFQVATPEGGLSGNVEVRHDLASGEGDLRFDDLSLDLDILNASETFTEWPYAWDVTSGSWRIEGSVGWRLADSGLTYKGQSIHTADSLAGSYGDVGFVGFGTQVELSLESGRSPVVAPAEFEMALVEIGFPIEDISGRFELDIDKLAADFEALEMSALGGVVRVAPFRFDFDADSNDITLDIESVQLPLMVGLADLDSVDISGTVSGGIPISVRNGKIVVEDGYLEADPPGGAIRYGGSNAIGIADDQSQLGIVTRTLKNFQYEELTSEVHYNEQGDLTLQMRLTGTNPDVDPDQPVILNLGIENNVPQMLRSLQATRSIEEVLEKKLGN